MKRPLWPIKKKIDIDIHGYSYMRKFKDGEKIGDGD
jgi:hypothetical protein